MKVEMNRHRIRLICGWLAVMLSTAIACFWAFWGIIENFHEGWYGQSVLQNLGIMFVQYLSPMIVFVMLGLIGVRWHLVGGALHSALALAAVCFFGRRVFSGALLIASPLFLLGALYFIGLVSLRKRAAQILLGLPLLVLILCGIEPAIRVSQRVDDGDRGSRIVEGNGVRLGWAPQGPGWPDRGMPWAQAKRRCRYLTEDGTAVADTPQDIWRLPTVEEAVRSMARHGRNCGGEWDEGHARAIYTISPDKESPLWNTHSLVIYWWTATEIDDENAYMIVYDGKVWPRNKRYAGDYFAFRAVRDVKAAR